MCIITLVCVVVEFEVGSGGSVSSLKVLLDVVQPGKLDGSDRCPKHISKWYIATNDCSPQ